MQRYQSDDPQSDDPHDDRADECKSGKNCQEVERLKLNHRVLLFARSLLRQTHANANRSAALFKFSEESQSRVLQYLRKRIAFHFRMK